MATGKIDQHLRAEFKELARNIIARDRDARKHGLTQNTIGEIERALVRAYDLGCAPAAPSLKPVAANEVETILEWILIPPRARDLLSRMTIQFSTRWGGPNGEGKRVAWFVDGGRRRWHILPEGCGSELDPSVADGSAQPLIRLGLLAPIDAAQRIFGLTAKGIATSREYWRRSDANDPTLPVISMR